MDVTVLVNGQATRCLDVADRGFQYGDGVFTTLPVRSGVPLFLAAHLDRLERDCLKLGIPIPGRECLILDAERLCRTRPEGVLKIQITRGAGGRGYRCPDPAVPTRVLSLHPLPGYPAELAEQGVDIRICRTRLGTNPALAGVKHMNRLEQILARAEWTEPYIREGLMRDGDGWVVEGTMTNLFLVENGGLVTPRLDRCGVAGVMRGLVMAWGSQAGRAIAEDRLNLERVYGADELFLTNSVIGLWPVRRCGERTFPVGPVTREVRLWLTNRIRDAVAGHSG
jgi:4-amino-4-deoxychorismate lyase